MESMVICMILALLQARMSSTRLPGKVLLPVLGQPMLLRQIERIKRSAYIDKIMVVTSVDASDDPLVKMCEENGIACFRGSLQDVLDRYYQAACAERLEPTDYVVRLTGDCPVIDPYIVDAVIQFCRAYPFDYVSNTIDPTFPDGMDAEVFTFSSLQTAWQRATLPSEREHVTPYIKQSSSFLCGNYRYSRDLSRYRLTVDERADYQLILEIYQALYPLDPNFRLNKIIQFLEIHPEIAKLNHAYQRDEGYAKSVQEDQIWLSAQQEKST